MIEKIRIYKISFFIFAFLAFCAAQVTFACGAAKAEVTGPVMDVSRSAAGAVTAQFDFSSAVTVKSFYLSGPDRLVIDVSEAVYPEKTSAFNTDSPLIKSIRIAQNKRNPDVVRIVFDLKKQAKLHLSVDEQAGRILVGEEVSRPFPDMSVKVLKDRVEVRFKFNVVPIYTKEYVEGPPRFVLDFEGYAPGKKLEEKTINEGVMKEVRISHFNAAPDVTRVVIENRLPAEVEVDGENGGKTLVVKIHQFSAYGQKVAVDAGHGGKDPGAQYGGVDEKDITLDVALRLRALLEAAGAKVIMTRTTDRFVSLEERNDVANRAGAKLFLSVHANALPRHDKKLHVRGVQILHYSKSSCDFARIMHDELAEMLDSGGLGTFERKRLAVLKGTKMKAVIAELGFMSHADEFVLLGNDVFRDNAARGLFNGLNRQFGGGSGALAAIDLPADMLAYLPGRTNEFIYVASGNVLEDTISEIATDSGMLIDAAELDLDEDWLFSEEGLTHEFGQDADDGTDGKDNVVKSKPANFPVDLRESLNHTK